MTDKEALELLNMFTTATQLAKAKNKREYHLKLDESTLIGFLKKAFPYLKKEVEVKDIATQILNN